MSTTTPVRIAVERGGKVQPREDRIALWAQDGLAVTRSLYSTELTITHATSGYAVLKGFRTQRLAIAAARSLLPLGDWTRSRTALERDADFKRAAKRAAAGLVRR